MIAFLRNETGAATVANILTDPQNECYAHALNLREVFYDFARSGGETAAQSAVTELLNTSVIECRDLDMVFWQKAGRLKAVHRRVSNEDNNALYKLAAFNLLSGTWNQHQTN